MMAQISKRTTSVKSHLLHFIKRLLQELFRKILSVKVSVLLWIVLCSVLALCTLKYTSKTNHDPTFTDQLFAYPVIVWWTEQFQSSEGPIECPHNLKCQMVRRNVSSHDHVQAYLFYGSHFDLNDLPLPRKGEVVLWGLFHEESPRNTIVLTHEKALNLFNYSSTFSRYSDYPFPLQHLEDIGSLTNTEYFFKTPEKNKLMDELSPIIFLQSECNTATEREVYVAKLMELMKIDSYGECLNNKVLPDTLKEDYLNNIYEESLLRFVARYKFMITIENGVCQDYITEKLWRALIAGTVPIYFGSPTVIDWLPNNDSAILLEDYPTPEILKGHLEKLMKDDELYESYLTHKTKRIIRNQRLYEELELRPRQYEVLDSVEKFQCLICEKLHERLNGVKEYRVLNRSHYDCPKPISALTLDVNMKNFWAGLWEDAKSQLEDFLVTNIK